ncbi:tetratricopeptide repeat protein [Nevskia sp.]|uniref:tetratricopeptide repeat protein n=1 Tax=Nevskia sp. TaxID=1929292 RepID=UPI00260059DC|nr:tetratricopeptide repeat protein [Nevskia sp.]
MHASRPSLHLPLGFALSVLGGCLTSPALLADTPVKMANREAQAQYHILAGELAAGRNQPMVAAEEFLNALEYVADAALAARATMLALSAENAPLALSTARKWIKLDSTSLEAREVIIRLALRAGYSDEAFDQGQAIVKDHPGGPNDGFRHVSALLSQETENGAAALTLMERLVASAPKRAGAWHAQGLLALRFNDIERAERSAREALRLDPKSKEAPLLLTGVLVRKGDIAAADQILEAQVRNSPTEADVRIGYARLLIEAMHTIQARSQLNKVLKLEADNSDALFMLGLLDLNEDKVGDAEKRFQVLAMSKERSVDAHYYLGRIAEQRGELDKALDEYSQVSSGQQVLDAAVRRAEMLARLGRLADARATLEQLRRQYPQIATRFYLAEGQLLNAANELDEALRTYSSGLAEFPGDGDLLYARSLAHERLKNIAAAEADLRAVLALEPADARALNALGFMLTVHSERLDEAETLIGKALAITPDEPSVIDSMGWLRFRQGRPNEAVSLLSKAYDAFPDPEVAAHFGEALWATGDHVRAEAVWKRALEATPEHPVLRETVKRLLP